MVELVAVLPVCVRSTARRIPCPCIQRGYNRFHHGGQCVGGGAWVVALSFERPVMERGVKRVQRWKMTVLGLLRMAVLSMDVESS